MKPALIVIGTSLGGLNALTTILSGLPPALGLPVAIVQHRSPGSNGSLVQLLAAKSRLAVVDAEDKMPLLPQHAYLAPADYHLLVESRGMLALSTDPHVRSARPSIDVLFESAAQAYGAAVVGVVLTGASADGAQGLRTIADRGGVAIVEDPASAECAVMPDAARAATPTATVLSLPRIADYLAALGAGARV